MSFLKIVFIVEAGMRCNYRIGLWSSRAQIENLAILSIFCCTRSRAAFLTKHFRMKITFQSIIKV